MNDDSQTRRIGEHLRVLLEILKAQPQGLQAKEALARLTSKVTLNAHEAGDYPSGGRRFEKMVRFASVGLVKAGWMTKTKGVWVITAAGQKALDTFKDPTIFRQESLRLYYQWKKSRPENFTEETADETGEAEDLPELIEGGPVVGTFEEAEESAWDDIRKFLRQVDPYELQTMVAGLLKAMGFHIYFEAPPGPDGGIDIIAFSDPLGSKPPRMKVQVKRETGPMSPDQVRSFMSLIGDGEVGVFVNVGGFSRNTQEEVRKQMTRHVTLDDEGFFELWVKHYAALEDIYKEKMPIRPIHFLAPAS